MSRFWGCFFGFCCVFLVMGALAGCAQEDADPAKRPGSPQAPAPPTPEEIAEKILTDVQLSGPMPRRGSRLPAAVRQNILDTLKREKVNRSGTEVGDAALAIVRHKIDERVRDFERAELWEHVLTYSDAHMIFNPGSKKFNHVRERALDELKKPRLTLKGLPEFDGRAVAMLSFYIPMTSQTHDERLALGEEMHGIRLLEIFGQNRGVRVEYIKTGERFIVYLPAAK